MKVRSNILLLVILSCTMFYSSQSEVIQPQISMEIYIQVDNTGGTDQFSVHYPNGTILVDTFEFYRYVSYHLIFESLNGSHELYLTSSESLPGPVTANEGVNSTLDVTFTQLGGLVLECGSDGSFIFMDVIDGNFITLTTVSTTVETTTIGSGTVNNTETVTIPSTVNRTVDNTVTETKQDVKNSQVVITETAPFFYIYSVIITLIGMRLISNLNMQKSNFKEEFN